MWQSNDMRAAFSRSLAEMYGGEVALYHDLVRITGASNVDWLARRRADLEASGLDAMAVAAAIEAEIGAVARVEGERHGAIRLGSLEELAQIVRLYHVLGLEPVSFYNLTEAGSRTPVVGTAGRPLILTTHRAADGTEESINPFRMFTSVFDASAMAWDMLPEGKRRYLMQLYGGQVAARDEVEALLEAVEKLLAARCIFPDGQGGRVRQLADSPLLALVEHFEVEGGLPEAKALEFIGLVTELFRMSDHLVLDGGLYERIRAVSEVAADILAFPNPHINHLTPRALDIQDAYDRMKAEGDVRNFSMLNRVQGPPTALEPTVLLNQTSYNAKPSWVALRAEDADLPPLLLERMVAALEGTGLILNVTKPVTLAGFGLALDLAGLSAERLLASTLPDEAEMLRQLQEVYGFNAAAMEGGEVAFWQEIWRDKTRRILTLKQVADALARETGAVMPPDIPPLEIRAHTARFGEIEQRGIALTPKGRAIYDMALTAANNAALAEDVTENDAYQAIAAPVFKQTLLWPEEGQADLYAHLVAHDLAYFTYHAKPDVLPDDAVVESFLQAAEGLTEESNLPALMQPFVDEAMVQRRPVIYEDFLPKSADGIFKSNQLLAAQMASKEEADGDAMLDPKLQEMHQAGVKPHSAYELYEAEQAESILQICQAWKLVLPSDFTKLLEKKVAVRRRDI